MIVEKKISQREGDVGAMWEIFKAHTHSSIGKFIPAMKDFYTLM